MFRLLLASCFAVALVHAADNAEFVGKEYHKPFENPTDDPKLPRVLIIGDSISIAYTTTVRRELKGKANVHRVKGNCAYSASGVKHVKNWIGHGKWDVIHFNFGLWDWYGWKQEKRATVDFYKQNMAAIVKVLKTTNAKLIFGTTTPPCEEAEFRTHLVTDDEAKAFNDAAIEVMKANDVGVNDLFEHISADRKKYTKGKQDVHWNKEGSVFLGKKVAAEIAKALP